MDTQQKDEAIAEWYRSLNTFSEWGNPYAQYGYLMRLADRLLALGQIDPFDRFEMVELLIGAYSHHAEQSPVSWLHPASEYAIYDQAGQRIGSIRGKRYFIHSPDITPDPMAFLAQIQDIDGEERIITTTYQNYGRLCDRYVITNSGEKYALVETGRRMRGEDMSARLDDPDMYRAIIDSALIALEEGNMPLYIELWERESFSIFTQCSSCCDRFELREDCPTCSGQGFIEDPQCPSKLLPGFGGQPGIEGGDRG